MEYVNNEMVVTGTPAVTNFYLAEGEKNGIGTQQSHERYEILMNRLKDTETMETNDVRDALDSVSKCYRPARICGDETGRYQQLCVQPEFCQRDFAYGRRDGSLYGL